MYTRSYTEIGTVTYKFNPRARRVILKIKQDGSIWVTIPPYTELGKAETFMLSKIDWIRQAQAKIAKKKNAQKTIFTENRTISHFHTLVFSPHHTSEVTAHITKNRITIHHPISMDLTKDSIQTFIHTCIEKALRIDAKNYIPQRVAELAKAHNFSYKNVRITSAKTRWGSCSGNNTLNFSLHIMRLPLHLIDFIIIHELSHTIHKNHGTAFHKLVNACCMGKEKIYSKELKQYSISQ